MILLSRSLVNLKVAKLQLIFCTVLLVIIIVTI